MFLRAIYDVPAPAKLNLFLHIVGRRADGYHLLQSVFVLIDWADRLQFEIRHDGALHRHDEGAAMPAEDLCLRAARALQAESQCTKGVDITLGKHLPWGAGMGGGSSDAASTLLALNRLWGLHWPRSRLAELGLGLGADVPFFIGGQNAIVQGIGELLHPVDLPPSRYMVLKPAASISTAEIFGHPQWVDYTPAVDLHSIQAAILMGCLDGRAIEHHQPGVAAAGSTPTAEFGNEFKNDLQAPAQDRCVQVSQAARLLSQTFGNSRMTGSGSAVFAALGSLTASKSSQAEQEFGAGKLPGSASPEVALQAFQPPADWVWRECVSLAFHPLKDWAD